MTWKELADYLNMELKRTPAIADMTALVWLHSDDAPLLAGEHEVFDIGAYDPTQETTLNNRLSIGIVE